MELDELQEEAERWYEELYRLMWAMVWDHVNSDRWLLDANEIFGELSAELVKVVYNYCATRDDDEMKRILIVSLRNRCTDLVTMAYLTHRSTEGDMHRFDVDDEEDGDVWHVHERATGVNDSYFDLSGLLKGLSEDGQRMVMEVLYPSDRTIRVIDITIARKQATSPKNHWKVRMTPLVLRRALGWDERRFDLVWEEVESVLLDVI